MNRSSSTTISAELGLKLVVPQQTIVPLVASMYYSGSDPYAVRMAFHVGTDEPVEWIFARDLLAAGIEARQGEGDVQVWPSAESAAETAVDSESFRACRPRPATTAIHAARGRCGSRCCAR